MKLCRRWLSDTSGDSGVSSCIDCDAEEHTTLRRGNDREFSSGPAIEPVRSGGPDVAAETLNVAMRMGLELRWCPVGSVIAHYCLLENALVCSVVLDTSGKYWVRVRDIDSERPTYIVHYPMIREFISVPGGWSLEDLLIFPGADFEGDG